ncbi:MAG: LacI family transcriptional regulator [Tannerellaceae bacterium]|jgi:LacI family transcriptional regulator|nr:LacI family transcriptional regulator [Tannerellaceae bacterium]
MRKVSIKDVAQRAGVSNATVSLVLNGKEKDGRVGKEVADRVRKIATEMNYQPNALARSLQSGRTHIIGLIVADISNPFFSSLAYYVQDQMEHAGYSVIIMNTNENDQDLEKIVGLLNNHQVDGYVIVPTEKGEKTIMKLQELKRPLVLLDRSYTNLKTYAVMVDGSQASFEATSMLMEYGCKRIGLISYEGFHTHMAERRYGYMHALLRAESYKPELESYIRFNNLEEDVEREIIRLIEKKVDGILFATNSISLTGIKVLLKHQIKIPEMVRVVCFDKSEAFEFMRNPVPYIQQPIETMGRKAADLLLEQMEGKGLMPQTCRFPATLVRRDR